MHVESTLTGCKKFAGVKSILLRPAPELTFRPQQLERAMLLVLLPLFSLASIALALADVLMGTATWFERYQLIPAGVAFGAVWFWCGFTRSNNVRRIRAVTLLLGPGIVMERFLIGLWYTAMYGHDVRFLSSMSVWMILASCLFVFLKPGRGAFIAGFGYYSFAVAALLAFLALARTPVSDEFIQEFMLTYIVGAPIFLTLLAGFARLRSAYGSALHRADKFESMAMQDALTGLFNRRVFSTSMRRARARQARRRTPVSMAILDIDHFKSVNDSFGHNKGDEVLVKVANILTATMRRTDDVFRWGGEEFAILMEETDAENAALVCERLRQLIESENMLPGRKVTASFGVAELIAGEDDSGFFSRADAALYDAKDLGRNQVVIRKKRRPSNPLVKPISDLIDSTDFGRPEEA
ncbi:MAG: GGDEF domain-containing protein [Planctomycetota bacterium]|nr:GGDEF domain-containing protein [Planctomycetota bacterium]